MFRIAPLNRDSSLGFAIHRPDVVANRNVGYSASNLNIRMSDMKSIKAWYVRFEAKNLASLAPEERADALAFDASFNKRPWLYATVLIVLWLVVSSLAKALSTRIDWWEALALGAVMLMSMIVAFAGAWFGPAK